MIDLHEVFPALAEREVRWIQTAGSPDLPADTYAFVEHYCVDPWCDCRRVLLVVMARAAGRPVATILHAFDPEHGDEELGGTFLEPDGIQSRRSQPLLELFLGRVLDAGYAERLESHYRLVKDAVDDPSHPVHETLRALEGDPGAPDEEPAPPPPPRCPPARRHERARQRTERARRAERAFLFDAGMSRCLAEVDRDDWERAIGLAGGVVAEAAALLGIGGIPRGARALWGGSAEAALGTYRGWLRRQQGKQGRRRKR